MSSRLIIEAKGLSKSYPLYASSTQRLLSLFSRKRALAGPRHNALENVDLEVGRGEKLAVIGRNGAGKSTLLKLVTQAIEPTSGFIRTTGKSHALLQLGVGFHPEFSGRENAYSFLAHMGKSGTEADRMVSEAVSFAEIEEYVDQPLKTYSSGMAARLMFAVSTIVNPDLLVIDEVLGVGDAYFQNKSFERIREMCDQSGTTLLLVTHDIYSAAKLCERMIWIEQGRIHADGAPDDILKLYEDSIRIQEDSRQKQKLALAYRSAVGQASVRPLFLEIRSRNNEPAPSPMYFAEASLLGGDGEVLELPLIANSLQSPSGVFVQQLPHTAWGEVVEHNGRQTRRWDNFGTVDHKIGFALFPEEGSLHWIDDAKLVMTLTSNDVVDADVVLIKQDRSERILGNIISQPLQWETHEFLVRNGSDVSARVISADRDAQRQGSGRMIATSFNLVDAEGNDCYLVEHGGAVTLKIAYQINDQSLRERCQIVLAFKRNGVEDVLRIRGMDLLFTAQESVAGTIEIELTPLCLGIGRYSLTTLIAKEGYYENSDGRFFSINPDVYDCQSTCLEFEVVDRASLIAQGTGYVGTGRWRLVLPKVV